MKATGIVRRIDDLGRIVVPKEIRRTLRIREGDPLEIFTDREGEIILKKYSPIGELSQFAGEYAESLAQTTGHLVLITDCDHVVTASGNGKKEYEGKPISKQLEDAISERKNFLASRNDAEFVKVIFQWRRRRPRPQPDRRIRTAGAQHDHLRGGCDRSRYFI